MNVLLVSGFLGSGKTTLILALARQMVGAGHKVAIVENEVGEIGIDGALIRRAGLTVRELFNGCICCQLSADLVPTLEMLAVEVSPDYIIIEPSGIAEPRRMLDMFSYYHGPPINSIQTITLVDPTRIPELIEVLTPLITTQVKSATTIVINKIDIASNDELDITREIVRELNPNATVVALSARAGVELAILNLDYVL
jgi:G3E family GTPase